MGLCLLAANNHARASTSAVSHDSLHFYFCCLHHCLLFLVLLPYRCAHFCFGCFPSLYALILLLQVQSRLCIGWLSMSLTLKGIQHTHRSKWQGPPQVLASGYRALEWQAFCAEKPSWQPGMMSECVPCFVTTILVCDHSIYLSCHD